MRVLSVDDKAENRYLLEAQLAARGWHVVSAKDGVEALERLEAEPFDVIVSDILMPHMDGFQLCQEVKKREQLRRIPFVFYTATYTDQMDEETGLSMGASRFLVKPSDPDTFANALLDVVDKGTPHGQTPPPTAVATENVMLKAYNERLVQKLDRKVAQLELASRELREVFEKTSDAILVLAVREDGFVCEALNHRAEEAMGLVSEQIVGRAPEAVLPFDVGRRLAEGLRQCIRSVATTSYEALLGPPERRRTYDLLLSPVKDDRGVVCRVTVFARDVTERIQAQEVLRDVLTRLQEAVTAGQVGLWDWDLRTNELRPSVEWKRQLGHDEHEVMNDYSEWERRLHPDDRDRALLVVREYLAGTKPAYESEFRLRHKNGSYRHILARASQVLDESGRRVRLVGSHVDITERVAMQTQLLQSQKMECVGRLATGVAHDFNNLLTAVLGYSELSLARLGPSDPLRPNVEEIYKAGNRAAALTRQLLVFSRREVPQHKALDLNAIVADLKRLLERLIGEDVTLRFAPGRSIGRILADSGQVEQVIVNLCVNARDAMPSGGRLMIATAECELVAGAPEIRGVVRPGPYVVLSVSDTGTGMTAEVLSHIFEPFFTTKAKGHGTGLGLSTVYGIVEGARGYLGVSSEVGKGSTFRVYFPRVVAGESAAGSPDRAAPRGGSETILLVEDDDTVRRLAEHFLESSGYRVLASVDGRAALVAASGYASDIDLVLTDLVMPEMSGRDLVERLTLQRPGLRVLYTSGYAGAAGLQGRAEGPEQAFLQKPFTKNALLEKVREVLDGAEES